MVMTMVKLGGMKTVSKSRLKARMLEYFREIEATGEPLIVTDRGREALEIRPVNGGQPDAEILAELRALAKPGGDIDEGEALEPLPSDLWEAQREDDRNPW